MWRCSLLLKQIFGDYLRRPRKPVQVPQPPTWRADGITGSCLGHATVLLNFFGTWMLTDPIFSARAGPGFGPFTLGPKRHIRPALKPRQIPSPDVLLLSHAHFDHFDLRTLKKFDRNTPVVTARGTADLLRPLRFRHIHELRWHESVTLQTKAGAVQITALEVSHWGARMMRDLHRGYNGYLIEREGHAVCFGGDTAYTSAFARLRTREVGIDLMLMPIGAYDPWIRSHCSPEQAVMMAQQAGARSFVPIHHETFKLSAEPMDEPAARVRAAFADAPERLLAVQVGETFSVPLKSHLARDRARNEPNLRAS